MSIVSKHWVEKFLVGKEVRTISDLLDEVNLRLCAAIETDIPFLGWISCVETVLHGLRDDCIVFSCNFLDYLDHVRTVLQRLQNHGIKLKARKCKLFRRQVSYLSRIISSKGYYPDPKSTAAATSLADSLPKTVGDL